MLILVTVKFVFLGHSIRWQIVILLLSSKKMFFLKVALGFIRVLKVELEFIRSRFDFDDFAHSIHSDFDLYVYICHRVEFPWIPIDGKSISIDLHAILMDPHPWKIDSHRPPCHSHGFPSMINRFPSMVLSIENRWRSIECQPGSIKLFHFPIRRGHFSKL